MHPFAQGRIRQLERVGNGLEALPFDNGAHGLGTAEDAGFPGLLYEGISSRERGIGKVQFEGPHMRVSNNKLLQKFKYLTSPHVVSLL